MKQKLDRLLYRITKTYKRRNIQLIISISFTLIAVFGMLILGLALYSQFTSKARENAVENDKQVLEQVGWNLNTYIRNMMSISDSYYYSVIKKKDLAQDSFVDEMDLLYEANKDNLISIACVTEDGALIAAAPVANRKEGVDFVSQNWFREAEEKIADIHFSTPHVQNMFENSNFRYYWVVSLSRSVELTNLGSIGRGVLLVDMNFSAIEQMFSKVNEKSSGYVYLMDRNGEIIYHPKQKAIYSGLVSENNLKATEYEDGDHTEIFNGVERSVIVKTVGYTGWKIVSVTPTKELTLSMAQTRIFTLISLTITIFLVLFGNIFISTRVTDPLRRLDESVRKLEEGNLDVDDIYIGGSHEIMHLGRTINSMVTQMRKLMDDMVKEQRDKRRSELDALQSQINPHFLYNTLDSVVWMIESERYKDAITTVTALATLFRISLSRGDNIIPIRDEIVHAQNYLNIQKVRYKNKFTSSIEIDPAIEDCCTIKLIVQPLLENAIYYGAMDEDSEISVKGYEKDGDIFIEVSDNGMGMPEDVLENLLKEKSKTRGRGSGIGLWNVNQRIQLYFKGDYGLSLKSELDEGTTVTIHLPKISYAEYKKGGELK
ncbi:MAG: sensor histidine kinase [Lachnospiraceae bacterium]|nr:sensor histidine kinase [Lachnospiraceae bacterium]